MAATLAREIDNFLAIVHDLATGSDEWTSRPAWIEFAPNNLCNLRCIMCGQADGLPLEVMPTDRAIAFLDQVLPNASLLSPTALSEPMLANIKLMVQKCREHGVWLNFHTNATVLNGTRLREIADRMQQLWISFDSHDPATFETLRARAKFDAVVANIRSILPVAKEHRIPVGFVAVFMRHNASHMAGLVDFLADLGAAEHHCSLRVQSMLDNSVTLHGADPFEHHSQEELLGFLEAAAERARARGLGFVADLPAPYRIEVAPREELIRGVLPDMLRQVVDNVRRNHPGFCSMATHYLKVMPNGDAYPCCRAPAELRMGNVNERPVDEIWNGPEYRAFRRRMHAGDHPEVCRTCSVLTSNPAFAATQRTGG